MNRTALEMDDTKFAGEASRRESEYFNSFIASEGDFDPFKPRGRQTLANRFTAMVNPSAPINLLDIGCGTGNSRQIYESHLAKYTGVDLSTEALARARQRFPSDTYMQADACNLPYEDNTFDGVCFSSVLHHIEDYGSAVREAARVVKPGGFVFAFDPNLLNPQMALFRCPRSPLYTQNGVSPNERPLLPSALCRAFQLAELQNIQQRCQSYIPYRLVAPKLLNAFIGVQNFADMLLEFSQLGRIFGLFVVTCGRKPLPPKTKVS
jgi:ubiquinone/menaquinone biosynthesis C-methylase UbiE